MINYQNKCRLIRGWDDLFNKLKEYGEAGVAVPAPQGAANAA